MTRQSQESEERLYVESFLPLLDLTDVELEKLQPSRPDFRVIKDQNAIGIEVTEYHASTASKRGHSRRLVEQEWERLRRELMRRVDEAPTLREVHATLMFKDLHLPSRQEYQTFIGQLIGCATKNEASLPTSVTDFGAFTLLSAYLKELRLKHTRCSMSWDWNHNTAWLGTDSSAFVNCVASKVRNNYDREGLSDLWLLIVSGPHSSQAMGVDLQHSLRSISGLDDLLRGSGFAKVYVFQYMFDVAYGWPGWKKIGVENFRRRNSRTKGSTVRSARGGPRVR